MAMNPVSRTYAASATGSQTPISVDWRDTPNGLSYEVVFNSGAAGSVTVDTTLDNVNDASLTPVWEASSAITSTTRGTVSSPVQFIRLTVGSLAGGTLTFKVLEGAPDGGGLSGGGGGGGTQDVNLIEVGGAAIALGQAAMAASLPVVIASNQSAVAVTSTQLPAALGQTTSSASLPVVFASDAGIIGVAYGGAQVSVTRPNDTTPYNANDVVGGVITFSSMGPSAGRVMLTSSQFQWDVTAIPSGATSFFLALYNVTPPSAYADNAAWDLPSGDRNAFLGIVQLGTPVDLGSTLYIEQNIINKQIKLAGTSLFAYCVTVGGYTPAAQTVQRFSLHTVGLGL